MLILVVEKCGANAGIDVALVPAPLPVLVRCLYRYLSPLAPSMYAKQAAHVM